MKTVIVKERTLMSACKLTAAEYVAEGVSTFMFLDLDGVFVPDSYSTAPKAWFQISKAARYPNPKYSEDANSRVSHYQREPKSFEVRWSKELIERINRIAEDPTVQIVWVTTWREDMGGVVDFMGIKSARTMVYLPWAGPLLAYDGDHRDNHSYKVPAVDDFLNRDTVLNSSGIRIIWADDIALKKVFPSDGMFYQFSESNVLLLKPVSKHGLSRNEVSNLEALLDS